MFIINSLEFTVCAREEFEHRTSFLFAMLKSGFAQILSLLVLPVPCLAVVMTFAHAQSVQTAQSDSERKDLFGRLLDEGKQAVFLLCSDQIYNRLEV